MKSFLNTFFLAGLILLGLESSGFAQPCASSLPFSGVLSFTRQANGQMVSLHDCDRDGVADYQTNWTVVEFTEVPYACADPYDRRHLIVPRSGFYRILAEPVRAGVISREEQGTDSRSFQHRGRW